MRSLRLPKVIPELNKFNGEPITRDDLHYLYTSGPEQLMIKTIAFLFDVEPLTVFYHMHRFHISQRMGDNFLYVEALNVQKEAQREWEKKEEIELNRAREERSKKEWQEAEKVLGIKKPEVEYVTVDGKRYRDDSALQSYNQRVKDTITSIRIKSYQSIAKTKKELNAIRHVDLSAMRLHRGLDMFKFSEVAGIPYKQVVYYEKTANVIVPKEFSDIYFKVLNISPRELKKIKEVLTGKRKSMFEEDDRTIPTVVRNYVWKRDGGRCTECDSENYLHFHHIEKFSDGGRHQAKNLKLLCVACHALEHYGEPGYAMLKAKAEQLGVMVDGSRKASKECI